MLKKTFFTLALMALLHAMAFGQGNPYTDVAVIVNDNSPASLAIGNYFAQQRGIPASRVLHVGVPAVQTVDSLGFEDYRAQVEAALIGGNLLDTVQYLVTTKGLPAQVSLRNGCDSSLSQSMFAFTRCTCAESELSLILGPSAGGILQQGGVTNPYYGAGLPFSRDSFGVFLVGRLDGYSEAEAMAMVDNGGVERELVIPGSEVVMDNAGFAPGNGTLTFFDNQNLFLDITLSPLGYPVLRDTVPGTFVANRPAVMAYVAAMRTDSMTPQDPAHAFLAGSIAHLWYNVSPITADDPLTYETGDVIADGAAVVATFSSVGFSGPSFQPYYYLPLYLDSAQSGTRYNAAEATYQAHAQLSLQSILYGDPKTSLRPTTVTAVENPVDLAAVAVWPVPTTQLAHIRLSDGSTGTATLRVTDMQGRNILSQSWAADETLTLDVGDWGTGIYLLHIANGKTSLTRKLPVVD